jgi:hypothetical protein
LSGNAASRQTVTVTQRCRSGSLSWGPPGRGNTHRHLRQFESDLRLATFQPHRSGCRSHKSRIPTCAQDLQRAMNQPLRADRQSRASEFSSSGGWSTLSSGGEGRGEGNFSLQQTLLVHGKPPRSQNAHRDHEPCASERRIPFRRVSSSCTTAPKWNSALPGS